MSARQIDRAPRMCENLGREALDARVRTFRGNEGLDHASVRAKARLRFSSDSTFSCHARLLRVSLFGVRTQVSYRTRFLRPSHAWFHVLTRVGVTKSLTLSYYFSPPFFLLWPFAWASIDCEASEEERKVVSWRAFLLRCRFFLFFETDRCFVGRHVENDDKDEVRMAILKQNFRPIHPQTIHC